MEPPKNLSYGFDAEPTVEELIAQQGKRPISDPRTLLGDVWPKDEPVERFLSALREWRGHGKSEER